MASNMAAVAVCELCEGTRWKPAPGGRGVVRCDCVEATRVKFAEGVPLEFRDARFANYRVQAGNKAAMKTAEAFLESRGDLLLVGPVGSGKTRLACTILNEAHQTTRGGLFVRVPKLLLDLQLMFGPAKSAEDRDDERRYCERLFAAPLLVLDDVGVEKASDYTNRTLYTLYEERSDRGHRTIWTSNLGLAPEPGQRHHPGRPPTLGEFLGDDRLPSRIAGRGPVVYLNVRDQRLPFRGAARDAD
jgi:DNA replication protein DnaC